MNIKKLSLIVFGLNQVKITIFLSLLGIILALGIVIYGIIIQYLPGLLFWICVLLIPCLADVIDRSLKKRKNCQ
ncbi:MAG: hypothetical protein WC460_00925 [Patescibacteria group bacterium]